MEPSNPNQKGQIGVYQDGRPASESEGEVKKASNKGKSEEKGETKEDCENCEK